MANDDSQTKSETDLPAVVLQTVYFHESERPEALRLGEDLYGQLTRPFDDPLAFGAGIPVLCAVASDRVELKAAQIGEPPNHASKPMSKVTGADIRVSPKKPGGR